MTTTITDSDLKSQIIKKLHDYNPLDSNLNYQVIALTFFRSPKDVQTQFLRVVSGLIPEAIDWDCGNKHELLLLVEEIGNRDQLVHARKVLFNLETKD